jgi:hypothetical protein
MPIIETVSADQPLSQGDILQGIKLYSTAKSWAADDGSAVIANKRLCLVISRPCNCQHKQHVIAVAIEKYSAGIPKLDTFEDIQQFLQDLRDGNGSPDVFYIGDVPQREGRFAARLDSFHTVEIPIDATDVESFLRSRRIGRLHIDFIRELHARIFRAFASLGFDDYGWLSNEDLNLLIQKGKAAVAVAEAQKHEIEAQKAVKEFSSQQLSSKPIEAADKALEKAQADLAPYIAEAAKRQSK